MLISIVSGGFDPIHSGHVRMIREASLYGGELFVLVNSDEWLLRKKGYVSMCLEERMEILRAIDGVSEVHPALDDDGTVCESLLALAKKKPDCVFVFCNGGDRGEGNTPEMQVMEKIGGRSAFGIGGTEKQNSSSNIWPKHSLGKVQRLWGSYFDHFRNDNCVFKTLEVEAGRGTSMQRHSSRDEFWFMERGYGIVLIGDQKLLMETGGWIHVPRETWHSIIAGHEGATIREMQIGICSEDDIERK
jgi:cytidyltransferase-like protein